MANDRHVVYFGGQFYYSWFNREPDRRAKGGRAWGQDQLLGLLPGWGTVNRHYARDWHRMDVAL